jgi:hypothetical protein
MQFIVRGVPQEIADEVRRTRRAPGYGHPAHQELARGTGPCRCCLRPFVTGAEQRLLFTFRPRGDDSSLMAPGPVFVHAEHCDAYAGPDFPADLCALPLAFEARSSRSRVLTLTTDPELDAETQIARLFANPENEWLHVRHAQAGCFIARVDRAH